MKAIRAGGALLLSTLAFGACSDTNGPGDALDAEINADAALVAADAAIEDVRQMTLSIVPELSEMGTGPRTERSRSVTFFDADGNEMDRYDPQLTASMQIVTDMSGEVDREGWSATIERHRDITVSGLLDDETTRVWNGTSEGAVTRSRHTDGESDRSYEMTSAGVMEDVTVGVPRRDNPWPLSGTITRTITVEITNGPNGDATRTRTVVVEFNGSQFATLTVNGETFEVDLAARDRQRPARRR